MNPRRKIVSDLSGGDSFWRKRALNPEKRRVSSEKHAQIGNSTVFLFSNTPKSRNPACFFRETRLNREFRPSFFRETRLNREFCRISSEKHAQIKNSAEFLPRNTPKSRIPVRFFRETRLNREFRPSFFRETRLNREFQRISSEKHAQIENSSEFLLRNTPKSRIPPKFLLSNAL